MSELTLVWAAAMLDAEGSIYIANARPTKHGTGRVFVLRVSIATTNPVTASKLLKDFRLGWVSAELRPEGNTRHLGHRTMYRWGATSRQAMEFLKLVRPYSIEKAAQADVALAFADRVATYLKTRGRKLGIDPKEVSLRMGFKKQLEQLKKAVVSELPDGIWANSVEPESGNTELNGSFDPKCVETKRPRPVVFSGQEIVRSSPN